jgi:hypothetical protein
MTSTDQLIFARIIANGMTKQAIPSPWAMVGGVKSLLGKGVPKAVDTVKNFAGGVAQNARNELRAGETAMNARLGVKPVETSAFKTTPMMDTAPKTYPAGHTYMSPENVTLRAKFGPSAGAAPSAAQPAAPVAGNLWAQNKATADANWQAFRARPKWQQGAAAYGGITAATAPATAANNAQAEWQEQHPVMSWLGKTFGDIPEAHRKSYLRPSFLQ